MGCEKLCFLCCECLHGYITRNQPFLHWQWCKLSSTGTITCLPGWAKWHIICWFRWQGHLEKPAGDYSTAGIRPVTAAWRWLIVDNVVQTPCGIKPSNTKHFPNVVLMLARRRRRRANIKTTLRKCLVIIGKVSRNDLILPFLALDLLNRHH